MTAERSLPAWAVQRVAAVLASGQREGGASADAVEVARRTGLSKSLARRCLYQLRTESGPAR
ncbi:hypothetical protein [Sinomonas mesophila]|uniref:hypothetical protein n=1 Tax=Sinomonas mesophila TaxID=1531955 RepID=UPI0009852D0A|nr:hypothetical protein [Sinomonas mesophila]